MERRDVLDHGYVDLVEAWGSDERIVEAARMSTNKGFARWGTSDELGDERLLRYLWTKRHTTPFEQCGLTVEVQAPIFVFREWHRHRTQSYNELSARYTQMPNVHYVPSLRRITDAGPTTNKQAQGVVPTKANDGQLLAWIEAAARLQQAVYAHYEEGLALGIQKEVARLNTPVARYSRMRASANLLNWLRFLGLRTAPDAQWEIRQYAEAVSAFVATSFPRTAALFAEQRI